MTTLFIIRHGPTKENHEGRIQGQQPGTLLFQETEQYLAQVVPLLREKSPEIIVSSDLGRAAETRKILRKFLQIPGLQEGVSALLREKAMGFYEGMLWKDIPPQLAKTRSESNYDFRHFGGENDEDVQGRVRTFLRQIAQEYPEGRLCCITHAGWIKQLVSLADKEGVLPDGWSGRTAIYEAGVGQVGQLQYFHPIYIRAHLPEGD